MTKTNTLTTWRCPVRSSRPSRESLSGTCEYVKTLQRSVLLHLCLVLEWYATRLSLICSGITEVEIVLLFALWAPDLLKFISYFLFDWVALECGIVKWSSTPLSLFTVCAVVSQICSDVSRDWYNCWWFSGLLPCVRCCCRMCNAVFAESGSRFCTLRPEDKSHARESVWRQRRRTVRVSCLFFFICSGWLLKIFL